MTHTFYQLRTKSNYREDNTYTVECEAPYLEAIADYILENKYDLDFLLLDHEIVQLNVEEKLVDEDTFISILNNRAKL